MWKICGTDVAEGEKKQLFLETGVENYELPATLICGKKPGKTVLITACIHGDEYPGVAALIRLAKKLDPEKMAGRLLLLHCVNRGGFREKRIALIPEDGRNLNADYPGQETGTPGEKLAAWFVREIFPQVDFVVDLHSGSLMEPLSPCLFFPGDPKVRERALEAAQATEIPYLIESFNKSGEVGYAAFSLGIPGLLLERGHSGYCPEEWVEAYEKDLRHLLGHFEMYAEEEKTVFDHRIVTEAIYDAAEEEGLWYPAVKEEMDVKKGELLGHTEDFFGNVLHEYYTKADGRVFYYYAGLPVKKGANLVAYGKI